MEKQSMNFKLLASVVAVNLLTVCTGSSYSWTSPALPKLHSYDPDVNPLGSPITVLEESLIGSLISLGGMLACVAAAITAEKYGRRKTLIYFSSAFVISHLMIAFIPIVEVYVFARFLMGFGVGSVLSTLPSFVGEISEDSNRGLMGSVMGVSLCCGILLSYSVGPFVSIRTFSLVSLIPLVVFYPIVIMLVPESPYFYASVADEVSAESSLNKLRISSLGVQKKELAAINAYLSEQRACKASFKDLFKTRVVRRGLIITCGTMIFQQLAGIAPVLGFLESLFEGTDSSLSPEVSVIIVGIIQIVVNILVASVVDRYGRKILLIVSTFGCVISSACLGTYYYFLSNNYNVTSLDWLPITSLICFLIFYHLGLGPVAWTLVGEVFSSNIKSIAACITTVVVFFAAFIITMIYPLIVSQWGRAATFWFFSGCSVVGFLFVISVIRETKGRSLKEIQELLSS